ncbi:MAG: hypothetical protein IT542_06005 [Rubellimicrobium sp.]|nr:hypothetical protein [Rubellimicrobium sp.]
MRQALDWMMQRRALARWERRAEQAGRAELSELRRQRAQAQALRQPLDRLLMAAETRLALPRVGSTAFPRPAGTDWGWRPMLWRGPLGIRGLAGVESQTRIGDEITLFHDCRSSEITLRQMRNHREDDLAPFGLHMDVFAFDGSFLSLVLDLPPEASAGLKKRHLIRVEMDVETERPLEIFLRLNVRHGPNVEQLVREVPNPSGRVVTEFDMAYSALNERRSEAAWLDLILEGPQMNRVVLRDLTFARCPRAEL